MNISIILPAGLLTAAVIYIIMRHAIRRKRSKRDAGIVPAPDMAETFASAIKPCGDIISSALECLVTDDDIKACRTHRTGADTLAEIEALIRRTYPETAHDSNTMAIYLNYMLDATEKIAGTSRLIVTRPGNNLSLSDRCEIDSIRHHISSMISESSAATGEKRSYTLRTAADNKAFIEHLIDMHSKSMSHEDFNDGSTSYSLLSLLYYLHSFINSFQHLTEKLMAASPENRCR